LLHRCVGPLKGLAEIKRNLTADGRTRPAQAGRRTGHSLAHIGARDEVQLAQHRQVGVACRGNEVHVRQVGDRDKADMRVLAVEGTPGQRLVDILKPMGADEIGVAGDGTKVTGVCGATFALSAHTDQAFPERPRSVEPK
jgi:hypothetical protein